ncbi:MAG: tRNA 2-selenouridine(34) synthase MnmH, partial [Candidatus Micrarchaeaceae archaeon]
MIGQFLSSDGPLIDVRSPSEFSQGHIPGALNIPLFSDAERAAVGTCYKRTGHDAAVRLGLSFVGPKMNTLAEALQTAAGSEKRLRLLCFRGGMRSSSMIWLAQLFNIKCLQLTGGYKAFRRYCQQLFEQPRNWRVIGGYTGSGKTELLQYLTNQGHHVLDLEAFACHRGSAFGALPDRSCPTTEQFENEIAFKLKDVPQGAPIYVEDESRLVGYCVIPRALFEAFSTAEL